MEDICHKEMGYFERESRSGRDNAGGQWEINKNEVKLFIYVHIYTCVCVRVKLS